MPEVDIQENITDIKYQKTYSLCSQISFAILNNETKNKLLLHLTRETSRIQLETALIHTMVHAIHGKQVGDIGYGLMG